MNEPPILVTDLAPQGKETDLFWGFNFIKNFNDRILGDEMVITCVIQIRQGDFAVDFFLACTLFKVVAHDVWVDCLRCSPKQVFLQLTEAKQMDVEFFGYIYQAADELNKTSSTKRERRAVAVVRWSLR
jgi:hypothetical protein